MTGSRSKTVPQSSPRLSPSAHARRSGFTRGRMSLQMASAIVARPPLPLLAKEWRFVAAAMPAMAALAESTPWNRGAMRPSHSRQASRALEAGPTGKIPHRQVQRTPLNLSAAGEARS